jgi:hypothetical protein
MRFLSCRDRVYRYGRCHRGANLREMVSGTQNAPSLRLNLEWTRGVLAAANTVSKRHVGQILPAQTDDVSRATHRMATSLTTQSRTRLKSDLPQV